MWFKNLVLYRFTKPFTLSNEDLDQQLESKAFRPVGDLEPSFMGWEFPLGRDGQERVHTTNGYFMLCARKEDKILPASAVKEVVDSRALEIEEKEGRKVRGKERANIKDEVLLEMMPKAFTRNSRTYAYIDPKGGWMVVDAGSPKKAEELTSLLRETIGSLPIVPLNVEQAPSAVMTAWLKDGGEPANFNIEDECELRDPGEDGGTVKARKQDLGSDEIRSHLDAGKMVTRLALTFDDRMTFVLDETLAVKRLKFLDLVQDEAADRNAETAAESFDADFAIMALELNRFFPDLIEAFGGEQQAEGLSE